MKKKICLLVFTLFVFSILSSQEKYKITWDFTGLSFREFVTKTESLYPVRFFYNDEWVKDLKLVKASGSGYLSEILDSLFKGTSLFYFIDDDGNIILTKDFAVKFSFAAPVNNQIYLSASDSTETQMNRQQEENLSVDIGNPADKDKSGNVTITGYIKSKDNGEPVIGAAVFVKKLSSGTISNDYGFYSLTLPRGNHLVQYSFMGMKEKKINLNLYGNGELNIEMNAILVPLRETFITAQRNSTLLRFEVGMEKINIVSFKLMPTSLGETDILKNILLIPGIKSVGEGSSGFNVRGGSADQNLILLYGAPVYNASHFFGFFSAINSDIIKDVTLYKGGIPARYGGRISSVLDIEPRIGSKNEFKGSAGISPIMTHLVVEGPLIKDKCSVLLSARSTYSNWLLSFVNKPSLQNSRASFYDINSVINYDFDKDNKLELSSYFSHDSFRFNSDTTYKYDNNIISLKWRHFFNSRYFSTFSVNNSYYNYAISSYSNVKEGFILSHKVNTTSAKADFNWYPDSRNEINYGIDLCFYNILPGSYLPASDLSLVIPEKLEKERALESALYIDDKLKLTEYLSINAGVRLSSCFLFGPRTILVYDPDSPASQSNVTDTIGFRSNKIYKSYAGPEFRISLNFKLTANSSVKINYNRTRQYLHLLSNTTSISPTDIWKLSDYYLKPVIGDQFSAGIYKLWFMNSIETSAEFYYKDLKNLIDFKGGANLIMNENIEQEIVNVKGKTYGMELMLKKAEGKFRWSISYTYSRSLIKSLSNFPDGMINSGKWFPSNWDIPNNLNVTLNYILSRRFSISSGYTYSTGRPVTYPVSVYMIDGLTLIDYSDRNKYRVPDYSRLDLSVKISGNLKSHKFAYPNWTFSVYNLLGRYNVYSVYFMSAGNTVTGYKLSVFARAIPTVTCSFDF